MTETKKNRPITVALRVGNAGVPRWLASVLCPIEDEGIADFVCTGITPFRLPNFGWRMLIDGCVGASVLRGQERSWDPIFLEKHAINESGNTVDFCFDLEISIQGHDPGGSIAARHHWDIRFGASGTFFYNEMSAGAKILEISIVSLDQYQTECVIEKTGTKAANSLLLSVDGAGWKAAAVLDRSLRRYLTDRPAVGTREVSPPEGESFNSSQSPSLAIRSVVRVANRLLNEDAWYLAWRRRISAEGLPSSQSWQTEHQLVAPAGRFFADPFILEYRGQNAIFYEDYDSGTGLGTLACVELSSDGIAGRPCTIMSMPHHLSYPFVFELDGHVWMIPETHQAKRIELWQCIEYPFRWTLHSILMDQVRAVDATLFQHGGLYWIFAGMARRKAPLSEELHLYWSDSLFGPWTPHAENPVVDGPLGARPAGRIFFDQDRIVRPAQDVSSEYGGRIIFQEILELSPEKYSERRIQVFDCSWVNGADGVHTYDRNSKFEIIDVRIQRGRFSI